VSQDTGTTTLRRSEQCLEQRKEQASYHPEPASLVEAADAEGPRDMLGNGRRVLEGGWNGRATAWRLGQEKAPPKPANWVTNDF
jgi:hypothetical protein